MAFGGGLLAGAATFVVADELLDRYIGGAGSGVSAFALLAGVTLDGVPENMALGVSLLETSADTGNYRSRVLSVQQTGDAAVGVVAEENYWGSVSFIDYFLLARIEGDWKIVCKLFAHTGGEPPEGV